MGLLFTDKVSGKQYTSLGPTPKAAGAVFVGAAGHYRAPNGGAVNPYSGGAPIGFVATTTANVATNVFIRTNGVDAAAHTYVAVTFVTPRPGDVYKVGPMNAVLAGAGPVYPLLEEY